MPDAPQKLATNFFVLLYALAWAGGAIAYTPLLTILLPARVARTVGADAAIDWMAYIAVAGAVAASLGGIGFGYLSDLTRNRRGWVLAGLVLSCVLLILIEQATTLAGLITVIVCWQFALNMMLGPLSAWAGDLVPDHKKGLLGGFLAFAPGLGALSGAVVTQPDLVADNMRTWLLAALVAICVLPVLLLRPPATPNPLKQVGGGFAEPGNPAQRKRSQVFQMWVARLLLQVAEATMFAYLFLWLLSLDPKTSDHQAARLFSLVLLISAPLALIAGRWSDRQDRPILPLQVCALGAALGLAAMAMASDIMSAMVAFSVFGLSGAVFLALHSAQTLRILPRPDRRGRDLGLFNLANTVPSLVMPWLTVGMVPAFGFQGLFLLLATLAAAASVLLVGVAEE